MISPETIANMKQNLGFAFVYNALGVPLAAGVLFPFTGWLLSPTGLIDLPASPETASLLGRAPRSLGTLCATGPSRLRDAFPRGPRCGVKSFEAIIGGSAQVSWRVRHAGASCCRRCC